MATPEMIAAVTAAVKGEDPPAPVVVDPPAGDPPAQDPPVSDPPAAAAAAPKEDLIGTDPAAAPADGPLRGPDGKFIPKAGDPAAPAAAAAPAAPAAAAPVVPPKPADHLNDPIPDNVKPATRERITTLVETVKAKDTEVAAARGDLEAIMAPIDEAGATPEQFRESMNLLKLLNSPHQHEQMQALQYLQGAAATLAERLGQVPPGTDPLEGFPDLQQQVQANPAMRKTAEEAARGRRFHAASQQHQQHTQRQTEQQRQHQAAVDAGQMAVREVEQTLEATDPQYKAKVAVLRGDAAFVTQLRKLPPVQWAQAFAAKYRTIQVAAAPAAAAAAPAARPGAPQPLRGKSPAGGTTRPPASMLEAITGALRAG